MSFHLGGRICQEVVRGKEPKWCFSRHWAHPADLRRALAKEPTPRGASGQIYGARRPHSLRGSHGSLLTSSQAWGPVSPTLNSPRCLQWSIASVWSSSKYNCAAIKFYFYEATLGVTESALDFGPPKNDPGLLCHRNIGIVHFNY